jgi:hypothetical protein
VPQLCSRVNSSMTLKLVLTGSCIEIDAYGKAIVRGITRQIVVEAVRNAFPDLKRALALYRY